MFRWLTQLLYESTPAEFRSAHDLAESVDRLRRATKRSAFSAMAEAAAVGTVTAETVRLQRVIPMVRNSFKPFFFGRFETHDGVTVLTGRFDMSMFTKIFMTFWLGVVALVSGGFLVASLDADSPSAKGFAAVPPLMLAAGLGLIVFGKWLARNDVAWLSGVIAQSLAVPPAGSVSPQVDPVDTAAVPTLLKIVALLLAAWSVAVILFTELAGPSSVVLQRGHWQLGYAASGLVLASGIWRRRPWAWWGGFLLLGLGTVSSLLEMPVNGQLPTPPVIRTLFGFCRVAVGVVWGYWWYAQKRHFSWNPAYR